MRWQLLNPEINSFTFRETKNVFEYRDVRRGAEAWELAKADGFAAPEGYRGLGRADLHQRFPGAARRARSCSRTTATG